MTDLERALEGVAILDRLARAQQATLEAFEDAAAALPTWYPADRTAPVIKTLKESIATSLGVKRSLVSALAGTSSEAPDPS